MEQRFIHCKIPQKIMSYLYNTIQMFALPVNGLPGISIDIAYRS